MTGVISQIVILQNKTFNGDKALFKCLYKLTDSTLSPFSYLNTVVKDFLPDHVTLISCGDYIQKPVRSKDKKTINSSCFKTGIECVEPTLAEGNSPPLNIERFQFAVVATKTLLIHELCNIWVGSPTGF